MNEQDRIREDEIVERSSELFAHSVRSLDGETRSKLARARARAVEAADSRPFAWPPFFPAFASSRLVPIGGVLAVALAIAVIWQNPEPVELGGSTVTGDLDILLEGENLELFEDLEFYAWLLEQPELLDGGEDANGSG